MKNISKMKYSIKPIENSVKWPAAYQRNADKFGGCFKF